MGFRRGGQRESSGDFIPVKRRPLFCTLLFLIGFLAPIWACVQVCCPFVAMVTTEPSGSLQGVSISGSLEACGVMDRLHAQMRVLFLLPVVTRLLGDRAGVEAWASVSPGRLRQGRKLTGLGVCPGLTDDREVLPGPRHLLPQH